LSLAAERGYTLLTAQFDPAHPLRAKADRYARCAAAAGHARPLERLSVARLVYVTDSVEQARDDLRPGVNLELSYQKTRGLLRFVLGAHRLPRPVEDLTFDDLVELGIYYVGDPDTVYAGLKRFYDESGGFGTLLLVAGKNWATREKRHRALRMFAQEVAPRLAPLAADRLPDAALA